MLPENKTELRRLTLFIAVGTLNTAICYALYAALIEWAHWDYMLALVADYGFGIVLGYALHRVSTFADRKNLKQAFSKYTLALIGAFVLNAIALNWIVEKGLLDPLAAQAVAMMLATGVSYALQKHWVFRSHGHLDPSTSTQAEIRA